jgi:hypothetical protein
MLFGPFKVSLHEGIFLLMRAWILVWIVDAQFLPYESQYVALKK